MSAVFEMHDSECIAIEVDENGGGFVLLDAYVHRCEGERLMSPHEGGYQRIRMRVERVTRKIAVSNLPARICKGSLTVGEDVQDNIIRFPAIHTEPVQISMTFADGSQVVVVSAHGLSIEPEGEFRFAEMVDF